MSLELILEYNMPPLHAKAYKLCLIWEKVLDSQLPGEFRNRLPKKGDPRDSNIFRHCLKLVRETLGLIPDEEYKLYILAQVHILKNLTDGQVHALIGPGCLVGDPAWARWRVWKRKYERAVLQRNHNNDALVATIAATPGQVLSELQKTKKFLDEQLGAGYDKQKLVSAIKNKDFIKWASFGKLSPYYLILSPVVQDQFEDLDETFSFDVETCKKSLTPEILKQFKIMFGE